MPRPFPYPHPQAGFSLLELSAVLAIIAVITAATLSTGSSVVESSRKVSTNNKLDAIEEALLASRLANNRLPCPGDPALTDIPANSTTYGYETGTIGTCGGGSTVSYTLPSPSSNTNIPEGTPIVEGAVPVKALGLPDEYQWDGWGRKFVYSVWAPLTATNAFTVYGVLPSCGAITIQNGALPTHGTRTATAAYALVSFGPDGNGGYLKSGTRYFSGSDNADEWTNCHCNATVNVASSAANAPAVYVQQDPTQTASNDTNSIFGDIVRYKNRWQLQDSNDSYNPLGAPCSPGATTSNSPASGHMGPVAVADVNGDGIPDLIIGAPFTNGGTGSVFVVFGTKAGFPDPLPLNACNGSNCVEFDGPTIGYYLGSAVAVADVNGDGIGDIIAGANQATGQSGDVGFGGAYVIFGHSGAWNSTAQALNATFVNGTNAIELIGPSYNSRTGWAVAGGDVNGDGIADILIGAPEEGSVQAYTNIRFNRFSNVLPPVALHIYP